MNKFAKILSAVISVTVALSIALVMLTSALAADKTVFAMNKVSETANEVVIEVKLESGAFAAIDFGIEFDEDVIVKCTEITANLPGGFAMSNPATDAVKAALGADAKSATRGAFAYTVADVDALAAVESIDGVIKARVIR